MELESKGLHHITIICGDPTENADFYVNTLGLRLVKKTVNHDAPEIWHLFYGDRRGTPGSSITFFPEMTDRETVEGAGMVTELGLRVPEGSLDYWRERLDSEDVNFDEEEWQGEKTLSFEDPDGLKLRIVPEDTEGFETWADSKVPEEHQIRGMHHVEITVQNPANAEQMMDLMSFNEIDENYFEAEDSSKVKLKQTETRGQPGKGSVHHVAFKVENGDQEKWRDIIQKHGMRPSPLISRKYFTSFYFRTPFGVLFEFSNMEPGYTADESVEELGTNFVLPEKLKGREKEILENLTEFDEEVIR